MCGSPKSCSSEGRMRPKYPVAILGATGTVGQKFVRLLADHPWFEIIAVTASEQSAGRAYGEAARWREPMPIPPRLAALTVEPSDQPREVAFAFSALDNEVAGPIEQAWARAGALVVTNASTHRMDPTVPLVIPEVNADHLVLLERQRCERGWPGGGGIVANPNCTTAGLALALAPLHRAFGVERLFVSTMQAISGAGWPGVASLDITGNVIPFIGSEEEKVERETRKLLGILRGGQVEEAAIVVSAHCNRVPVIEGHTETVSVGLARRVTVEEAEAAITSWRGAPGIGGLALAPRTARGLGAR